MSEQVAEDAAPVLAPLFDGAARIAIAAVIGAILAAIVLPPLYFLVRGSFVVPNGRETSVGFGNYLRLVADADFLHAAANSLVFALGSAVLALLFGGVVARLVEGINAPFKSLAFLTTVVSLGTPYMLYVSAWLLMLNRSGPPNSWWRSVTGGPGVLIDVYAMGGMILVGGGPGRRAV